MSQNLIVLLAQNLVVFFEFYYPEKTYLFVDYNLCRLLRREREFQISSKIIVKKQNFYKT